MIYVSNKDYVKILSCPKWHEFIVHTLEGKKYINTDFMPKDHYLPVHDDYVLGYRLVCMINEIPEKIKLIELKIK